ncbi:succinate dehydrogenase/fumarate reductase flavoprotein subunit [Sphaerochaeta pleomorpha str. Grapes]|uniref:Succinate dehydrogenase/fumarate reductase flavoprotein subunit n=1 Tax=Sphaerochaeta pleomorpha (strain ATCC BAA-1885 / DSM 22778 / Grapes) TaxID=158190 RepID=G8QQL0_SPHPG|nr:FAD-binding protein [Sphaerochaeta pleomorpha]AEV30940.1 succinate dehydrogenase/fumarate reductase flavoprotein subunit [Sphaerochaeta pleomorpha str. Grapes]
MIEKVGTVTFEGISIPVFFSHVLIIGSGAASLSCALHLKRMGCDDITIVTDNSLGGTSRNTGSDKQTYYRLNDSGQVPDSPYAMAESYLEGGAMHGDIAFVEAQGSTQAFYNLVSLGVPFPHNRYGGYTGYKTDHDPSNRGISLGPYTSRVMMEKFQSEISRLDICELDHQDAVQLLMAADDRIAGALFVDKQGTLSENLGFSIILSDHVVLGTGGPAGLYAASVYPKVHTGSIGLALEVGAEAVNLTESQFGLASTKVRWNLSGSYQQVLPRYFSTDAQGGDEQDFLVPYFNDWKELTRAVFLKGYQWPFDAAKIPDNGSSLIDLLVYQETQVKKRRVFVDYRNNLNGKAGWGVFSKQVVDEVALHYLDNSRAWAETPLKRLQLLNPEAYTMYLDKGVDLSLVPLEIDLCAQHNNGGLSADIWWESTNIKRLYPIGEVNGSHGVSRPGGSALNAGQVGAKRAATRIVGYGENDSLDIDSAIVATSSQVKNVVVLAHRWVRQNALDHFSVPAAKEVLSGIRSEMQLRMSECAGPVRRAKAVELACLKARQQRMHALENLSVPPVLLTVALQLRHMLISQDWYLSAIKGYLANGGGSRGSYLVFDEAGDSAHPLLPAYRIKQELLAMRSKIQVLSLDAKGQIVQRYASARPIPKTEFWFEQVWAEFRNGAFLLPLDDAGKAKEQ